MRAQRILRRLATVVLLASLAAPPAALAQQQEEEAAKPWSNETQIGLVTTSGNSSTNTISLSQRFTYNWPYSELILTAEAVRATADRRVLFVENGQVRELRQPETTAERYEAAAKFRQNVISELFWYVLGNWYRNEPAGIANRWGGSAGAGYRFIESRSTLLAGEAGIGVVREEVIERVPETSIDLRGFVELRQKISGTADVRADIEMLQDLQEMENRRFNVNAAITAQVNRFLALRASWQLRYDNQPAEILVRETPASPPLPFRLDTTDQKIGASLVITF